MANSNKKLLSKSRYVKGCQCPKLLWLGVHAQELATPPTPEDEERFATGNRVGELATQRYPGGVMIDTQPWEYDRSVELTKEAIANGAPAVYEASAQSSDGAYARADIFLRSSDSGWDIIEVKSSTDSDLKDAVKTYLPDLSLQYHVFTQAGYQINRCILLLMNSAYRKEGAIDVQLLFAEYDLTDQVLAIQSEVQANIPQFHEILELAKAPEMAIGPQCNSPFDCAFQAHCWKDVPEYSVFNLYQKKKAVEIAEVAGSYEVRDIPLSMLPTGVKHTDYTAFMENRLILDREALKAFLDGVRYPLYFLDYEALNPAIPLYDGTKPYQQVPFQFSLHIYDSPESEARHVEFIHQTDGDPRRALAEALVASCGSEGSVIVYYAGFERPRNNELAEIFPDLAEPIKAINDRMVDLWEPFKKRWIYHPKQNGSASIKDVLPTFTNFSYKGMEIANGSAAARRYLEFAEGKLNTKEQEELFRALSFYCQMDTLAMVKLLEKLREYV